MPLKRNADNTFEELTWDEALPLVAEKLNSSNMFTLAQGDEISAIIGEFVDVEALTALKDVFNRLDCDHFEMRSNHTKLNPDLRSSYLMNSTI
jgi:anaerobic selenocysteine-containing dehydrogenase